MTPTSYDGHCHCGAVQFSVESDLAEATTCDCSLCTMRGAVMVKVPEDALTIMKGREFLTEYRWNTGVARHFFCKCCGIYTFHKKRAAPDHYGVNLRCLDGVDTSNVPVRATDGKDMTVVAGEDQAFWPGPRV